MTNLVTPLFSIIIPCLNEEFFIPSLLQDLHQQTLQNFEVIVVDGRSDDQTQKRVIEFPLAKLLISPKRNVAHQRNLGAKHAMGKYLLFFDADNRLPNGYFRLLTQGLHSGQIDIFTTQIINKSNRILDRIAIWLGQLSLTISVLFNQPLVPGACIGILRLKYSVVGGFDVSLPMSEDHEFVRRCLKFGLNFKLFDQPRYLFSLRRFQRDGYLKVGLQWLIAFGLDLLNKNCMTQKLNYQMGGNGYRSKSK